ncbi:MAG: glycine cleavage system aminomethyltransferase GcvT [Bdellovibrionales bacterium]|nr:glycine cleavage system aminomethyltransferase GcvT [Bdellovibrionales bacterium]
MKTALFEEHKKSGGRMIDFGGWDLPVQYSGLMDEHLNCRENAGLFDVSHMGEFHVDGPQALDFLNYILTNDIAAIKLGQAQYNLLCQPDGGIVDDLIVYKKSEESFLVVVNAANTEKDFNWCQDQLKRFLSGVGPSRAAGSRKVTLTNESSKYSQLALQGRKAQAILQKICTEDLGSLKPFFFLETKLKGNDSKVLIARTGYTGEDGFEIYLPWDQGPWLWRTLLEVGAPEGLKPCGLGARDTLRLEVRYPLYGNDLTSETNPIEAGLGWVVKLAKGDFVGRNAIAPIQQAGPERKLVGIEVRGRGIPRQGYKVMSEDGSTELGILTSGTQSPSLKKPIALGYVKSSHAKVGTKISIDIRGTAVAAEVIATPFYKRPY